MIFAPTEAPPLKQVPNPSLLSLLFHQSKSNSDTASIIITHPITSIQSFAMRKAETNIQSLSSHHACWWCW